MSRTFWIFEISFGVPFADFFCFFFVGLLSNALYEKVKATNLPEYRAAQHTPIVKLAPLPKSAQFLNVIESIFSGMARAIIHNSDYQSVEAAVAAIDSYFQERNEHFLSHPKKAGKTLWGSETVSEFSESNNCKDPGYR